MERVCVVGATWRHASPEEIARLALSPSAGSGGRVEALGRLARRLEVRELVHLATCNRVELAFAAEPGVPPGRYRARAFAALAGREPAPGEAERALRAWQGEGAVEHLFLVAAGLDSARLGEGEIAAQVRDALVEARAAGLAGARLGPVFEEALRLARRIRARTGVGEGRTSLAEIALERVRARLARAPGAVALVGVSAMTERCACELASEGVPLVLVNRTPARAEALRAELRLPPERCAVRDLESFRAAPDPLAAVVLATGSPEPVLDGPSLARLAHVAGAGAPLLVDLAATPDADPEGARAAGLARVGLDDVVRAAEEGRAQRLAEASEARLLVDAALAELRTRLGRRLVDPLLAAVQRHYAESARAEAERRLRRELASVPADAREPLLSFVDALARRLAHLPTTGLREIAREYGAPGLAAFLRRADGPLGDELRRLADSGGGFERLGDPLEEAS